MSARAPGQWWTESWNPVTGCTPVGAGCDHCWAKAMAQRFPACHEHEPIGDSRLSGEHPPWDEVICRYDRLEAPLHWRKPRVVATCLLGDLFHEQVDDSFLDDVMTILVGEADGRPPPSHKYVLLTKRYDRAAAYFRSRARCRNELTEIAPELLAIRESILNECGAWRRVVLMFSVWDQNSTDAACAAASSLPAAIRWGLHLEPLLGPVRLGAARPSWIVVGAEQGPGARHFDLEWARSLRTWCGGAGVPFWFKAGVRRSEPSTDLDIRKTPWSEA